MKRSALVLLLVLLALLLSAQAGLKTNSIIGEIRGLNNLLLPNVSVEAYRGNQRVASTLSNTAGLYRFDNMQQGDYRLVFNLRGYQRLERSGINLLEGAPEVVDVSLQPLVRGSGTQITPPPRDSLGTVTTQSQTATTEPKIQINTDIDGMSHGSGRTIRMDALSDMSMGGAVHMMAPPSSYLPAPEHNTEEFASITPNIYHSPLAEPLSTFSIDVDTATYSTVRRMLNAGQLPPSGMIRIEEMINYFDYDYPLPQGDDPFAIYTELGECPWNGGHQLLHIGLKGREMDMNNAPPSNLVFLIDVSGSMAPSNKLPLVKTAMNLLVDRLRPQDRISIVTYASGTQVALPSVSGAEKERIKGVINGLRSGGSTAGAAGIQLAYNQANEYLDPEGNNRIILCTDGDFNVGISSEAALEELIVSNRNQGIFLTILGFGMGNYKDARMEMLADRGNGNYAYIDNLMEAKKVLVHEITSTLFTIAKDVKIQVEFNPAHVRAYRLIGYENRLLRAEDFRDDTKDAGELGAGHTVTALYEIVPAHSREAIPELDSLRYQSSALTEEARRSPELATVKLRYKQPLGDTSIPLDAPVLNLPLRLGQTSERYRFAAAVAGYGMLLQDSAFKANLNWQMVQALAADSSNSDEYGYRREFLELVEAASRLSRQRD